MWYFSASPDDTLSDAQVLLSMDRDSVVSDSTRISLSHVDRNSYRLLVRDVDVEDSGYYFCQAAVWVPLHNGSWYKVVERTSAPVSVVVTTLGEWFCFQTSWVMYHSFLDSIRKGRGPCRISSVSLAFASIIYDTSLTYKNTDLSLWGVGFVQYSGLGYITTCPTHALHFLVSFHSLQLGNGT